jgi:Na+-translocating ferredoxin:NAD+ oxidoreductase RnfG subunit
MNPFRDNIPLLVFASIAIGLIAGRYVGISDGMQREQRAQAERNRIQQELRWERNNRKVK